MHFFDRIIVQSEDERPRYFSEQITVQSEEAIFSERIIVQSESEDKRSQS